MERIRPRSYQEHRALDAVYVETFRIISDGLSQNPAEDYARLPKAAADSSGVYGERENTARCMIEKCADLSKNQVMETLLKASSHKNDGGVYDSKTSLYAAMADFIMNPGPALSPEKTLVSLALGGIAWLDSRKGKEGEERSMIMPFSSCLPRA